MTAAAVTAGCGGQTCPCVPGDLRGEGVMGETELYPSTEPAEVGGWGAHLLLNCRTLALGARLGADSIIPGSSRERFEREETGRAPTPTPSAKVSVSHVPSFLS